jgi:hypothetical protein
VAALALDLLNQLCPILTATASRIMAACPNAQSGKVGTGLPKKDHAQTKS